MSPAAIWLAITAVVLAINEWPWPAVVALVLSWAAMLAVHSGGRPRF